MYILYAFLISTFLIGNINAQTSSKSFPVMDGWNRIYLATFPRSGNHWMRFLLEESTHIATSSVYRDIDPNRLHPNWINPTHLEEPFPWGGYCPLNGYTGTCRYPTQDDPIVLKTHFPAMPATPADKYLTMKNLRIIRHPVDSCWSLFVHYYELINQTCPKKVKHDFVVNFISGWKKFHEFWNHDIDCVNLRYEDLLTDTRELLKEVIRLIGYNNVTDEDIERAVTMYPPKNRELQHIDHFEIEDLELMKKELKYYLDDFGYQIP